MSARQKAYEEPDVQNVERPTDWRFNRAHLEASSAPRGATPPPIVKVASNTRNYCKFGPRVMRTSTVKKRNLTA